MQNNSKEELMWGREFSDGWNNLYELLLDELKPYNVKIVQAKEKYGLLRVYCEPCPAEVENILHRCEDISETVCEMCGKDSSLRKLRGNWLKTICHDCCKIHSLL